MEKEIIKAEKYNMKLLVFIALGLMVLSYVLINFGYFVLAPIAIFLFILTIFVRAMVETMQLTVTDKRVYGVSAFGKRVDLPLDSISSVGTSIFKGVDVATSSGHIKFQFVKNQEAVFSAMSELIVERQKKETKATISENVIISSHADELKKYKDLLDSGVLTQEEFDAKKKQLLDL